MGETKVTKTAGPAGDISGETISDIPASHKRLKRYLRLVIMVFAISVGATFFATQGLKDELKAHLHTAWVSSQGTTIILGGEVDSTTGILKMLRQDEEWQILKNEAIPPVRAITVDEQASRALILCDNGVLLRSTDLDSLQFEVHRLPLDTQRGLQFYAMDVDWENGRGIVSSDAGVLYSESILNDTMKWGYLFNNSSFLNLESLDNNDENGINGEENLPLEGADEPMEQSHWLQQDRKDDHSPSIGFASFFPAASAHEGLLALVDEDKSEEKKVNAHPPKLEESKIPTISKGEKIEKENEVEPVKKDDEPDLNESQTPSINNENLPTEIGVSTSNLNSVFRIVEMNWERGIGIALDIEGKVWYSNNRGTDWDVIENYSNSQGILRFRMLDLMDTEVLLVDLDGGVYMVEFAEIILGFLFLETITFNLNNIEISGTDINANREGLIISNKLVFSANFKGVELPTPPLPPGLISAQAAAQASIRNLTAVLNQASSFEGDPESVIVNGDNAIVIGKDDLALRSSGEFTRWTSLNAPQTGGLSQLGYIIFLSGSLLSMFMLVVIVGILRRLKELEQNHIEAIAEERAVNPLVMVSGSPSAKDTLGFSSVVDSIIYLIDSAEVSPPVHIAVSGEWGSGKSSVMLQVKKKLEERNEIIGNGKFVTVWFNVWHLETQKDVLVSFLRSIYEAFDRQGFMFRIRTFMNRTEKFTALENILFWFGIGLIIPLVLFLIGQMVSALAGRPIDCIVFNPFYIGDFLKKYFITGRDLGLTIEPGLIAPGLVGVISLLVFFNKIFSSGIANLKAILPVDSLKLGFIKEELGFKENYKQDFAEIIRAGISDDLKLVVFIDDLDRVSGEKIKELLTAINFISDTASNFTQFKDSLGGEQPKGLPVYFISGMATSIVVKSLNTILEKEGKGNGTLFLEKMYDLVVPVPDLDSQNFDNLTNR